MKNTAKLRSYKAGLPLKVTVEIHRAENGGMWAKVKELRGCYTQADSFFELIEMVNDAIYTYLDIPPKLMSQLGYYMPQEILKKLSEETNRRHWQNVVRNVVNKESFRKSLEIFKLS